MAKIRGGDKNDKLTGTKGNDSILGLGGNDLIMGLAGKDTLSGGAGKDVFVLDAGNKKIDGGAGFDGIDLSKATRGIEFDFEFGRVDYEVRGKSGHATFKNIEAVKATNKVDIITGDDNDNLIHSWGGDDVVFGAGGNDTFYDRHGADSTYGGEGDDTYIVYADNDYFDGGNGLDILDFHYSFDAIDFTVGDQFNSIATSSPGGSGSVFYLDVEGVVGTDYNDVLTGNFEDNILFGGDGDDVINGDLGNDTINGGRGDDTIEASAGDDRIIISAGNDSISSVPILNGGSDTIDLRNATRGTTASLEFGEVISYRGRDGIGTSTLSGIDNIDGSKFADTLTGNDRANILRGMAGNDRLDGNAGDDVLVSDAGNETMTGDAGADAFLFAAAANRKANFDTITDFSVADDSLWFDRAVFGLTGTGPVTSISGFDIQAIDASEFQAGETATAGTADVRLIYETDTGILWYDADGNLSGKAVKLAQLGAGFDLTAADVFVV